MRLLLQVRFANDEFNDAVRDGSAGETMGRIIDELKPEALYFTEMYGQRGVMMIVDVADPSQVPKYAEPFFLLFNAEVEFHIVMSLEDLQRAGLEELGQKWAI